MSSEESEVVEVEEQPGPSKEQEEKSQRDIEMTKGVLASAVSLIRVSNPLPRVGDDFELCNSFPVFTQFMQQQEARIRSLLSKVLSSAGSTIRLPRDLSDIDGLLDRLVDADDAIIERAGIILDEFDRSLRDTKVVVPRAVVDATVTRKTNATDAMVADITGFKIPLTDAAKTREGKVAAIKKPQLTYDFASLIDNKNMPFVHRLKLKHHEMQRQQLKGITVNEDEEETGSRWLSDEGSELHPYAYELDHFNVPPEQLESRDPIKYKPLDDSEPTLVSTREGLEELVAKLNTVKEFAVDLEAHQHRSFLGLTCLVQISTREEDFIVDPFPIWQHMHLLNEPFTDPNILKVFHGADYDVIWLQRDFGVYVVNMFDTGRAMRRLNFAKFSLLHLVEHYTGVHLQKEYQTADWRIRPLPADFLSYARGDTHYLLYAYDCLREKLLEEGNQMKNLLLATYNDSTDLCKKTFIKPIFDPEGYHALIGTRKSFNNRQMYALRELWKWRDAIARSEDESIQYVLPSHMMVHIAEALPREMQGILACCSPIPVLVKQYLLELHRIVYAARDRPLEKTVTISNRNSFGFEEGSFFESLVDEANRMTKLKAMLRSRLDFSHVRYDEEIGSMLQTQINGQEQPGISLKEAKESYLSVLGILKESERERIREEQKKEKAKKNKKNKKGQGGEEVKNEQVAAIIEQLEAWPTPFERYTVAATVNQKRQEERRAEAEKRKKELGNFDEQGRRLYSHHDDAINRIPDHLTKAAPDDSFSFEQQQVMTKKALKKNRKRVADAADVDIDASAKEKRAKKVVKTEESADEQTESSSFKPVDYSQFNAKEMFDKEKDLHEGSIYDPMRSIVKGQGEKKGAKKQGKGKKAGLHRTKGMITSYGNQRAHKK